MAARGREPLFGQHYTKMSDPIQYVLRLLLSNFYIPWLLSQLKKKSPPAEKQTFETAYAILCIFSAPDCIPTNSISIVLFLTLDLIRNRYLSQLITPETGMVYKN